MISLSPNSNHFVRGPGGPQLATCRVGSPSTVFPHIARHSKRSTLFQCQTSISKHLEFMFIIGQLFLDSFVAACSLQFWYFLLSILQCVFLVVSGIIVFKVQAINCLDWWSFESSLVFHSPTCILQEVLFVRSGILHSQSTLQWKSLQEYGNTEVDDAVIALQEGHQKTRSSGDTSGGEVAKLEHLKNKTSKQD